MKKKTLYKKKDDYLLDIYNAKVEIAITKWELSEVPEKRIIKKS